MTEIKIEIHEQQPKSITINGQKLSEGDAIPKNLGLFEEKIDKKLLSIIAYLAIQKVTGMNGRWISADEIAFSTIPTTTKTAVSKYLERRIRSYFPTRETCNERETELTFDDIPKTHLIQYMPRRIIYIPNSGGTKNGLSRGPYRLGATIGENFSVNAAWNLIFEKDLLDNPFDLDISKHLDRDFMIETMGKAHMTGNMLSVRETLSSYIKTLLISNKTITKNEYNLQAEAFLHLGSIDMELGYSKTSIYAAKRSLKIFKYLNNKKGMADTFQLMAHGYGQQNQLTKSLIKAEQARNLCDSSRILRAPNSRAYYVGVLGQRASKAGNYKLAEKLLSYAQNKCNHEWDIVWSFRRAENFIQSKDFKKAELYMEDILSSANNETQTIPYQANISRVVTSFYILINEISCAKKWLKKSKDIGLEHKLLNHIRLIEEMEEHAPFKLK